MRASYAVHVFLCAVLLGAACADDSEGLLSNSPEPSPPPELVSTTEIGALPGHPGSIAFAINERGEVVGYSASELALRAFFWSATTGIVDLGDGVAGDLSDLGDVVGQGFEDSGTRAVIWERLGDSWSFLELRPLEDPIESRLYGDRARAIDALATRIVGSSSPDMGTRDGRPITCPVPVIWTRGTSWADATPHLLPTSEDGKEACGGLGSGTAMDVNDLGQMVGLSPLATPFRAVVWRGSPGDYRIETLPAGGAAESFARSINNEGVISGFVGETPNGSGRRVGVIWTPTGTGWRVDSLGPDEANGLNDGGLVVGEVSEPESITAPQEAWFWTRAGGRVSLGPGGALAVNRHNQVVGHDGDFEAVLWTLSEP